MAKRETEALKAVKKQILQLHASEIAELRPWILAHFDVQGNGGRINKYVEPDLADNHVQ